MSSGLDQEHAAAKAATARQRGGVNKSHRWRGAIPGIRRDGSLHPAIEAAQSEGSLMLMRGNTQRLRRAGIEKEAT